MTRRINRYRWAHCSCDEPIPNVIGGKLYFDNGGMSLENSSVTNRNKTDIAVERVSKCRVDTESDDIVLEKIVARLRAEFTNLIPDPRPDAIVYNMGYAAAIRDLEHIVKEVIEERHGEDGKSEYCRFKNGVDCMFEGRPLDYELPDTAAEVERTRRVKQKAEKEQGHTDNSATEKDVAGAAQEKPVLPIPCTKGFEGWTVKDYFQKINEELDEVKDAILSIVELEWKPEGGTFAENDVNVIAEEAADTITAITSMLEAMGIDERQRQEAQRRVNEHNRQRGRL